MSRWRRVVLACALCGYLAYDLSSDRWGLFVSAQGVTYIAFEQITVTNTAVGFTAAKVEPQGAGNFPQAVLASCRVRTAEISFTYDGTTPTTTIGQLAEIGDQIIVTGHDSIMRFKAIRTGASSGQLDCVYTQ